MDETGTSGTGSEKMARKRRDLVTIMRMLNTFVISFVNSMFFRTYSARDLLLL